MSSLSGLTRLMGWLKSRKNAKILSKKKEETFWKVRSRKEVFRLGVMGVTGIVGILLLAIVANTAARVPRAEATTSTYEEMKTDPAALERMAELNISYYSPCKMVSNGSGDNSNQNCGSPSGSDVVWIGDSYTATTENGYNGMVASKLSGVDIYAMTSKFIYNENDTLDTFASNSGNVVGDVSSLGVSHANASGLSIAKALKSNNKLRNYLVFALGTNGGETGHFRELLQEVGDNTKVVLMTAWTAESDASSMYPKFNEEVKEVASSNSNVVVADWEAASKGKESEYWGSDDLTHPNEAGFKVWVDTLVGALGQFGGTCTNGNCDFTKYNYDDETLKQIAGVAMAENGEDNGRFEMSLMANLFEKNSGYSSVLDYVLNSTWFAAKGHAGDPVSDEVLKAARDVFNNGNRTIPKEVDEHDCIDCGSYGFDVSSIELDGKTYTSHDDLLNLANYVSGKTVIHNKYGSTYTFYSWPDGQKSKTGRWMTDYWGDPFGAISGSWSCDPQGGSSSDSSSNNTTSKSNDKKTVIGPSGDTATDGGGGGKLSYETYNGMEYLQIIPENMEDNLPVIVYHVGSGEVGNVHAAESLGMIGYVREHASELYSKNGKFIFIAPSYGDSSYDSKPFVESVISKYKANSGRVIISGFSQGASTVYTQVQKYPDFYSAAAPADGCAGYFGTSDNSTLAKLKVSWYIMYGTVGEPANYETCNVSFSEELKANNGSVELVKLNSSSHSEAQSIFSTPELFAWMLGQGGNGNGGNNCTSSGDVGKLQEVAKTYAWSKDEGNARIDVKPAYQDAINKNEVPGVLDGTDCAQWTFFLINKSGWFSGDKTWSTTDDYDSYLLEHGWTDVTDKISSESDLLPGDIFVTVNKGHAAIYTGKIDGFSDGGFVTAGVGIWAAQADKENYETMTGWYGFPTSMHAYRDTSKVICNTSSDDPCEGSGSNNTPTVTAAGDVGKIQNALKDYAWPEDPESQWYWPGGAQAKSAYQSILCERIPDDCGGSGPTDCGHFVLNVLITAGLWEGNPYQSPQGIIDILSADSTWEQLSDVPDAENEWAAGDVIVSSGHVWMYGGKIDGLGGNGFYQASRGSSPTEVPHAMTREFDRAKNEGYYVFRKKNVTTSAANTSSVAELYNSSERVASEKTLIGPSGDTATDGGGSGGTMSEDERIEYVWGAIDKWMSDHNVNLGGGEKAAVIAGIMGNAMGESGADPFADGSCLGLFQDCPGTETRSKVNAAVGTDYWGRISAAPADAIKKAIDTEIDLEFGADEGSDFFNSLDKPSVKTGVEGAKAYAELFMITVERCVANDACVGGTSGINPSPITDAGVIAYQAEIYKSSPNCIGTMYQGTDLRKQHAETYYGKLSGNVTSGSSGGGGDSKCCGVADDGGGASGASVAKLQETAKRLIWKASERDAHPGPEDARPEYRTAWEKWSATGEGGGGGVSDCGGYVFTIIRESGWDPDFKQDCDGVTDYGSGIGASCLGNYMEKSSEWEEVHPASASDWQPGDVYQFGPQGGDHIGIYVGDLGSDYGGDGFTEASYTQHTPWMMDGQGAYSAGYKVYRKKNVDIGGDGSGATLGSLTYYHQCDEPWGSEYIGEYNGQRKTNCTSACGPTALAMMMHMYDSSITPVETIKAGRNNGTYGIGSDADITPKVGADLGFTTYEISDSGTDAVIKSVNEALDNGYTITFMYLGNPVETSLGRAVSHAMGIYKKTDSGKWLVADPGGIQPQNNIAHDKDMSQRRSRHEFEPRDVVEHSGETLNGFTDSDGTKVERFNGGLGGMTAIYAVKK